MKNEFRISYQLRKLRKDKNGKMPLYIRSKQNADRSQYFNTGERLLLGEWNSKKHQPLKSSDRLRQIVAKIQATYTNLMNQGHRPDLDMIVKHLDEARKPSDDRIIDWCDDYIRGIYSDGMKKAAATLKYNLKGFEESLTFRALTTPKIAAFLAYLTKENVANNSQYKRIRALINVAKHANRDLPHLFTFRMPYSTKNGYKARLTWKEVEAVIKTDPLSNIERMAKDLFLLACFSGLRIGDILTLPEGTLHKSYYERFQNKTKQPVFVTTHKWNRELFEKYTTSPIAFSRQKLGRALKAILQRAEVNARVTVLTAVGRDHKKDQVEKWEEISFHSGRRFYARLLVDLGLGSEIARDELGHTFANVTDLYAGNPDHRNRIRRVQQAMQSMESTMRKIDI